MVVGAFVVAGLLSFSGWPGTPSSDPPRGLPIGGAVGAPSAGVPVGGTPAAAGADAALPAVILPGDPDDLGAPGDRRRAPGPDRPRAGPGADVTPATAAPTPGGQPPPGGPPEEAFLAATVRRLSADAGSAVAGAGDAAGRAVGGSAGETVRRTGQGAGDGVRRTGAAAADAANGSAQRAFTPLALPVPLDTVTDLQP